MRNCMKRMVALGLVAALATASLLGYKSSVNAASAKKVKSVTLKIGKKTVTKKTYSLAKKRKATIQVKVNPKKAKKSVSFKSSNKAIAKVSKKGIVTAMKKGTAKITVSVKGKNNKIKKTWVKIKVKKATTTKKTDDQTNSSDSVAVDSVNVKELKIADGSNTIYGKMYTPSKEGVYPAIIMSHGYNGTNSDFVNECRYFAQNGYAAYAFDFCGGSGRSKSTGKSTDMTIFTEKSNLLAVFNHVKTLSYIDSKQIYLFGGSQGGLVTSLAAEEVAEEVKGMVLYFPAFNIPDDWRAKYPSIDRVPNVIPFWGLKLGKNFVTSIHDFYTFDHIGKFSKKVLILYGKKDAIVPYSVIEKAKNTYPNCELILYPNDGHGFTPATGVKARGEVLKFMQKQ